jgi:hypothetical protein
MSTRLPCQGETVGNSNPLPAPSKIVYAQLQKGLAITLSTDHALEQVGCDTLVGVDKLEVMAGHQQIR